MNRIWGRVLTSMLAAGALSAVMPACADNDRTIFVQAVLAPSSNRIGGACSYTNDPTQPIESIGRLDVAATQSYLAAVLIGNQLIARGDQAAPRAESNRAHIAGAVVHLADPNGGTIADFTSLTSGFADASANNVPGYGVAFIPLTDANSTAALRAALPQRNLSTTIVATFKVFGTTLGNTDVESGDFSYPIDVCNGCLISYPSVAIGMDMLCSVPADMTLLTATTNPCFAGQDVATDCRLCVGTQSPDLCLDPSLK